jgi:AcrR family transcriptional regulator
MVTDRKNEVLDAAMICFERYGMEKTILDDIGSLVGMNKASLYYYFKNKESIFLSLMFRESAKIGMQIQEAVMNTEGSKDKILVMIDKGLRNNNNFKLMNQLTRDRMKKIMPELEDYRRQSVESGIKILEVILQDGIERSEFVPCDTKMVSKSIHKVIYSMSDAAFASSPSGLMNQEEIDAMIEDIQAIVGLILDGIKNRKQNDSE